MTLLNKNTRLFKRFFTLKVPEFSARFYSSFCEFTVERKVVQEMRKDTLLCGNVSYFNEEHLNVIFGEQPVVLMARDLETRRSGHIRWFQSALMGDHFRRQFFMYDFMTVIYVSRALTFGQSPEAELMELRHVLELCRQKQIERFIFVTTNQPGEDAPTAASIFQKTAEDLCHAYTRSNQIQLKIIRSPYFISGTNPQDWLYQTFAALQEKKTAHWMIPVNPEEQACFIDIEDLSLFLYRLLDHWMGEPEELELMAYGHASFQHLAERLQGYFPDTIVQCESSEPVHLASTENSMENVARRLYGWYAMKDCVAELDTYFQAYKEQTAEKKSWKERVQRYAILRNRILIGAELVLGGLLVELLNRLAGSSAQFRMIDIRLLFVVIMSSTYGTGIGLMTAVMEVLSLSVAFYREGRNWVQLFYDPSNWLPFILLLLVSAVCGYLCERNRDTEQALRNEAKKYGEELQFVTGLYQEMQDYKNEYKRNLIESRDGFGRIFEVVERLSHTIPQKIFSESILAMEEVLNNHSIAIYSVPQEDARFARLEVCSPGVTGLSRSIELEAYRSLLPILDRDEVWVNRKLESGYPMLLSGVRQNGYYALLIMIYHVDYSQISSYYINLIRILRRLTEQFLTRAYDYQQANRQKTYLGDTIIVNTAYLCEQEKIHEEMQKRHVSTYSLLRVHRERRSLKEISTLLERTMRTTDIAGQGNDGDIYIIAPQSDPTTAQIILERYRKLGLAAELVEKLPGGGR